MSWKAPFDEGVALFKAGKYPEALQWLNQVSTQPNAAYLSFESHDRPSLTAVNATSSSTTHVLQSMKLWTIRKMH